MDTYLKKIKYLHKYFSYIILGTGYILLFTLQLHNTISHPINRGFDADGHIEYIRYLQIHKRVPLPYEGWELWQAPLYYIVGSLLPSLQSVKFIGLISWTTLSFLAFFLFRHIYKNLSLALIGSIYIAALPVVIYLTPTISNELFSATLISISLVYYIVTQKSEANFIYIILGVLLGLGFLSKATASILILLVAVDMIWRKKNIKFLIITFGIALIIAGWFYGRNIYLYQNPFIASHDFPNHPLHQDRIERNIYFLTNLSPFFTFDLFKSQYYSFIGGTFFSWYYDGHNVIIPVQESSKAGNVLVLTSIPIVIISLFGFIKTLRQHTKEGRIIIMYTIILLICYLLYNFKLPFYSTVKGSFIVSLALPSGYFFLQGLQPVIKYKHLISLYLFLYIMLVVKNFWILPNWYR